jgi:hypothetical protein
MNLDKNKIICIQGDMNTGKTNLGFYLLRDYKSKGGKREIYTLGYPSQVDDFINISCFLDVLNLQDSVIYIDELLKFFKGYDRHTNEQLIEFLSTIMHSNNTIIFATQQTQFITKTIENFIDTWCFTGIKDLKGLKKGSNPKRIIQGLTHFKCSSWSLSLDKGEYFEYSHLNHFRENGVHTFPFQQIGKDWKPTTIREQVILDKTIRNETQKKGLIEIERFDGGGGGDGGGTELVVQKFKDVPVVEPNLQTNIQDMNLNHNSMALNHIEINTQQGGT